MELFIELAPKKIGMRPRTHKVNLLDVAAFKRYVRGQVTGVKNGDRLPTINQEKNRNVRPSWAIVKSNSSPSSEGNILFIVSTAYDEGRLFPMEKTYSPAFTEGM